MRYSEIAWSANKPAMAAALSQLETHRLLEVEMDTWYRDYRADIFSQMSGPLEDFTQSHGSFGCNFPSQPLMVLVGST